MRTMVNQISDLYDNAKEIMKQTDGRVTDLQRQVRVAGAVWRQGKINFDQLRKFRGHVYKALVLVYAETAMQLAKDFGIGPAVTKQPGANTVPALTTFGEVFPELKTLLK